MKQYMICSYYWIHTLYRDAVTILFDNVSEKCIYLSNQKVYKFILSKIESHLHIRYLVSLIVAYNSCYLSLFIYRSDNLSRNSFIAIITHVVDNIDWLTTFLLSIESIVGMNTAAKMKISIKAIIFDKWRKSM